MRQPYVFVIGILFAGLISLLATKSAMAQCTIIPGVKGTGSVTVSQCPPSEDERDAATMKALDEATEQGKSLCRQSGCGDSPIGFHFQGSEPPTCTVDGSTDPFTVTVTIEITCPRRSID